MSNPYVQFELDAAKKAPLLASALGVQLREAVGGLTLMWLHIYGSGKGDQVNGFFLRTFFGVDGAVAGEALTELGFLEVLGPGLWRVRGASRYTRLSEKRSDAGRKGAETTNAKRSASAAANGGNGSANGRQTAATGRQTVGKTQVAESLPRQDAGKPTEDGVLPRQVSASAAANERQTAEKGRQKAALDPRSDISSPTGKRDIGDRSISARAREAGPPPDGGPPPHAGGQQETEAERHRRWRHGEITVDDLPGWTDEGYGLKPPHPKAPWPYPEAPFDWGRGPDGSLIRTLKDRDDPRHALQTQYWREQGWL